MAEQVKTWRYTLRTVDGLEGWGIVTLTEDGMMAAVTDYGNYVYHWPHHGCKDFREFFLDIHPGYLMKKLCPPHQMEEDWKATQRAARREIRWAFVNEGITAEEYLEEREWVDSIECEWTFHNWQEETQISEAYECIVYRYPAPVVCFCEKLIPRLAEEIRKDLEEAA